MIRITIQYLAQVKRAAGCASESVEMPMGCTLRDTLRTLAVRHDGVFGAMVLDEASEPRKSLLYFVGDDHADPSRLMGDGDAITVLAPMAGG